MNLSSRARGSGGAFPAQSNAPRQNEYFVPRDGIDREVITADICRYLGNDALVRPGVHTDDAGRVIQGYYITAYRNLTSAMIADLKNDSARWEAERRKHQSGAVRYQDSQIRDGPQRGIGGGGGGGGPYGMQPPFRDYDNNPHYPGSDAPGYSASGPGGPGHFGQSSGLGGYGNNQYPQGPPPQATYAPPPQAAQDPRFGGPSAAMGGLAGNYGGGNNGVLNAPLGQEPYSSGAHYAVASNRDYSMDMAMTDAPMAPARRTSPPGGSIPFGNPGNNTRGGYGGVPGGPTGGYGGYAPPAPNLGAAYAQPIDNAYGRAPNNTNPGFSPAHELQSQTQAQQYEDPAFPPSPTRAAGSVATSTQTQLSSSSGQTAGPRREQPRAVSERSDHRDRDRIDRATDRDRDRERDATPPNRTGSAPKSGSSNNTSHHHYGRR